MVDRMALDRCVALVPCRVGSKRVPGKNTRLLSGVPLFAYTLAVATQAQCYDEIVLCTDDERLRPWADAFGVTYVTRAPVDDDQPDIVWVTEALTVLESIGRRPSSFAILRPTSPFRTAAMLQRAERMFWQYLSADSLRAVEPVRQHPGKMWTWEGRGYPIVPLQRGHLSLHGYVVPWHSAPTQALAPVFVQNASLDMGWTRNVEVERTIHGRSTVPFFCEGSEGFDINTPADWREAEYLVATGGAALPALDVAGLPPLSALDHTPDPRGPLAG